MAVTAPALFGHDPAFEPMLTCDRALGGVGRKIRVLNAIAWPVELEERFLQGWRAGNPALPQPATMPVPLDAEIATLDTLMRGLDRGHPIGNWLYKSAWSYRVAARMLGQIGQPGFTRCSVLLYGRPDTQYRNQVVNNADAARQMLAITDDLIDRELLTPVPCDIPADVFAQRLREKIAPFFVHDEVEVVLDPSLASKATASSSRVRIRATAMFSEEDLEQLTQHEAYIHTATLLNGKHQPHLRTLGLGAPRTTRTQEGPGDVRRDHHRRHGYRAPAARGPARADGAGRAGRRRLHRRVQGFP
ncbi:tyrosine/phenylalanine carboxypeptidase domain-containing protein [Agrilutibacter solisilvae]|uniref:DUF1704 domain-containing protein n=1 Tax=Agrilutibacter solisilvae TaxID=2763317 RepID=A0A974Y1D5_9GAMM|nr:tyrosine/phenylalanine carboxypeptidase domain-containing protein [Lysobacter solisilvae]QSX78785.1 DUF1704 domain-containing protein [Lysobacter solisilvae]